MDGFFRKLVASYPMAKIVVMLTRAEDEATLESPPSKRSKVEPRLKMFASACARIVEVLSV